MPAVAIRPERPGDERAIRDLTDAAFSPSKKESRIVDALRGSEAWLPSLSLVAVDASRAEESEGDESPSSERIVGHCVCSRGTIAGDDGQVRPTLGLGPLSVLPGRQGAGIGGALVAATVEEATRQGWPVIVLLGHATYYPRFGFEPARPLGIQPPGPWSDEHWMALRLPAWSPDQRGSFRYPSAFDID